MIWSGLLIYWANDIYRLGWGDRTLVHFFPDRFFDVLRMPHRLADGMAWHFAIAWLFTINGVFYVLYTVLSGQWRFIVPNRRSFREAILVVLHDLRLRKQAPPIGKYNGAQQIAYSGVAVMGLGSVLTGLAIYKPTQLAWLCTSLGGYEWARWEHFWLTVLFVLFFVVHVEEVIPRGLEQLPRDRHGVPNRRRRPVRSGRG